MQKEKRWIGLDLLLALPLIAAPAMAATTQPLNISQVPSVYAQKNIAPNLFLLLDDSGSMQFECMGSRLHCGQDNAYGFPFWSKNPYNGNSYGNGDPPSFSAKDSNAAQYRATYVNPNYYNPAITYTPWACATSYPEYKDQTQVTNPITNFPDQTCQWDASIGLWVMPDAAPGNAYWNPANATSVGGFAVNQRYDWDGHGIWPATYFNYLKPGTSTDYSDIDNYQYVQICPDPAPTHEDAHGDAVPDCSRPTSLPGNPQPYHTYIDSNGDYVYIKGDGSRITRTYQEAMQNFANWFQYYRSHILLANAGIGIAFMQLPKGFRVDFGVISQLEKGASHWPGNTGVSSTEDFTYQNRNKFLYQLYTQPITTNGTPNRLALESVGKIFAGGPTSSAPWGTSQAENKATGKNYLSCRANYVLLTTDGMWNGGSPGVGNQDNEEGKLIKSATGGSSYQYKPAHPYKDDYSSTLADVAMKFWKTDLQTDADMPNNVPVNGQDNAFWQHMVTFTVGLGVVPTLVEDYMAKHTGVGKKAAQKAVFGDLSSGALTWPEPSGDSPNNIDDTWHAAVDGHGTFASASNPTELYQAISDALINIVNRTGAASSLSVNTEKTGATRTRQQVYQALFHPQNWWGDVLALPVVATPANGTAPSSVAIADQADWSASCVLTGGQCDQTKTSVPRQSPSERNIFTWNDGGGKAFESTTLSTSALNAIGGANVVNYIRGARKKEAGNGGTLRARDSVLGDVVSSSPVYVGRPNKHYADTWSNFLYPSATPSENSASEKYSDFMSSEQNRAPVVYAGANDGMLHGFYAPGAASAAAAGKYPGEELLAYVPKAVYANLGKYADSTYMHHYFVNATPGTGDLFDGSQWRTWLVGGEGAGGKSIFALDITDPASFGTSDVIGEWGPGNITCANVTDCGKDLGLTFGTPVITRFNNGEWGFVFGNGFNSQNGVASIFIGLVSGDNVTFYELKTGYGPDNDPSGNHRPDGIAFVTPVDLNGDHTTDYVYAGDYFGNVWRFDLASQSAATWHATSYPGGPLFSAVNANGTAQPITTKLLVVSVPGLGPGPRVMVEFGTGASVTKAQQAPNSSAAGVQSLYGIWDWKFDDWNSLTKAAGINAFQYDTISSAPALARSVLKQQNITVEQTTNTVQGGSVNNRVVTQDPVCWVDYSSQSLPQGCSVASEYGWYLDLVSSDSALGDQGDQGEKVVYNPVLRNGVFLVNTTIPSSSSGLTCQGASLTGWTMALNPESGGRLTFEIFDTIGNGKFDKITVNGQDFITSGITLGAVGSPGFVTYEGDTWMVVNTGSGKPTTSRLNLPSENLAVQLSWQELR